MNMKESELLQERAEIIDGLDALISQAESAGRGLKKPEEKKFNTGMNRVHSIDLELQGMGARSAAVVIVPAGEMSPTEYVRALKSKLDEIIDERVRPDMGMNRSAGLGGWKDADGKEVRLYRPDENAFEQRGDGFALPDGIQPYELDTARWLRGALKGDWTGAEAEHRAMSTFDNTLGGYMMPFPLSAKVIDLARAQSALIKAGALTAKMENKDLTLARVTSDPAGYWKQENASGTASDMELGALKFTAKTLIALVKMSVELFEDAPNAGAALEHALAEALRVELDRVGMFGVGASNEPKGLYYDSDLNEVDLGTNGAALTDYSDFITAVQYVYEANGIPKAGLYSPRTNAVLDGLQDTTNQPLKAPRSFEMLNHVISTQVSNALTKGTETDASVAFVGDFSKLILGVRKGITIEFSREAADSSDSAFKDLQVWARAYLRADWQVEYPTHLTVIGGIIPAEGV